MAFFDAVYQRGVPPWDIGHPQREFVHLEETGEVEGRVLDVGCGTGENALYFERRGHPTWGVDFSPTAIARARAKAAERGLAVTFQVASALELSALHETFDTVTDCGLFHTFSDEERIRYSASVASVLRPGAGATSSASANTSLRGEVRAGSLRRRSEPRSGRVGGSGGSTMAISRHGTTSSRVAHGSRR